MASELQGLTVAFLVAPEGFEQVELTEPWKAVERAGGTPKLISTQAGEAHGFDHLDRADAFHIDAGIDAVGSGDFDALVLPGGVANPDFLRTQPKAVEFARRFFAEGKPVAAICHALWTLAEADVVREPPTHVVAEPAHRPGERGRDVGRRRGGRVHGRTQHPRHQPQAGRPARLRQGVGDRVRGGRQAPIAAGGRAARTARQARVTTAVAVGRPSCPGSRGPDPAAGFARLSSRTSRRSVCARSTSRTPTTCGPGW